MLLLGDVFMQDDDAKMLLKNFFKIASKGWIKGINNSLGCIDLTFENELGKKAGSMFFPDYFGIKIKCLGRYSRYPISLFTCYFDGPNLNEINYIVEKDGYYDKTFIHKKVLYERLSFKNKQLVNNKYFFKIEIDKKEDKLFLCVF